jgi:valyl-tRNA synthetase
MAAFYPTQLLITGFDILFFWVARMIMMCSHFTGRAPFAEVHLTGLVRDARGQKMSKTKGNVMDPVDLVEQYGADAIRFTLAALASPGRDLPLDPKRMEGYRAFATKLWNAARFVQMNLTGHEADLASLDRGSLGVPDRWILAELEQTTARVNAAWGAYRFDEGCRELYRFVWNDFCDWYVEMAKPVLTGEAITQRRPDDVRAVARGVLVEALKLLHPVMPFITEEVAAHLGTGSLITAAYPADEGRFTDPGAMHAMEAFRAVVQETRSYRHLVGLAPGTPLTLLLPGLRNDLRGAFEMMRPELVRLASLERLELAPDAVPADAIRDVAGGTDVAIVLPVGALGAQEKERLAAELEAARTELARVGARLTDPSFTSKAPPEVVQQARQRADELRQKALLLGETLGQRP